MTVIDTSTEAVERLARHIHTTCGCALGSNAEQPVAKTLTSLLKERDEARARAATAFEMAAKVCTSIITDYDVMKADGKTYETPYVQRAAKGLVSLARQDIRALATDQERDALARVRAEAMREAAKVCDKNEPVSGWVSRDALLARADQIEKGETK